MEETKPVESFYVADDNGVGTVVFAPKDTPVAELKKMAREKALFPLYNTSFPETSARIIERGLAQRTEEPLNFRSWNTEETTGDFLNRKIIEPAISGAKFIGTTGKAAYNQAVDLSLGTLLRAEAWAENTGAEIAADRAKQRGMDYPNTLLQIRKDTLNRNRAILNEMQTEISEDESEAAQNLGSGAVSIGSMFIAFGLGNKKLALDLAKIFGLASGTSMYENLTMSGAPYDTATYRGAIAGAGEYALEKIGFEWLTNRIVNKKLYPLIKRTIEPSAVGALQETAQEFKDIVLEQGYVESTPQERLDRLTTAATWGAILEAAGTNVGYSLYRRQIKKNVKDVAIADGYDTKTADKIAREATPTVNQMINTLREEEAQMLEELPNEEQLEEYRQSLDLARGLNDADSVAEVGFYDQVRKSLEPVNMDDTEKRRVALITSLAAKMQYEAIKEAGTYGGGLADFIEENYPRFSVSNRTDTRATFRNGRITETPAEMSNEEKEEAWAEYQERNRPQMTDEERYREESGRGLLFNKSRNLTTRADGYPIADDNETVDVVEIPENAIPDFKTRADLRNWLIGKFEEIGHTTIQSTGANVDFNKTAAQRVVKNSRQRRNNMAYPEIEKVVSGAKYSGFRLADERHKEKVRGQDVYHSGITYKGIPYSVEFYVDVPLNIEATDNFAGNKIRQIRIAPTETLLTSDRQNRAANNPSDAIRNISLAVLRGKVNPARRKNGILYQRAYAGSRVDYDRPSLEAIGSGEGNQAHGWGLYYALDKDVAESYRKHFMSNNSWRVDGVPIREFLGELYNQETSDLVDHIIYFRSQESMKRDIMSVLYDISRMYYKQNNPEMAKLAEEKRNFVAALRPDDIVVDEGQVHEVEIPENPYLLDEQLPFSEQSDFVKEKLQELLRDNIFSEYVEEGQTLDDFVETEITDWELGFTGGNIYDRLSNLLGSDQSASSFLERYGIKGITYEGQQDGRAFVIFNSDDVDVIQKFYSRADETVRGTYNPERRLIELFADRKPETVLHEVSHYFFQNYFAVADKYGYSDYDRGMLRWLSKQGKHEIKSLNDMETQDWENLTETFLRYLNTGNAPTIATRGVFQKAKEWVLDVFEINRDIASNEVKDFFDSLVAREGKMPNIDELFKTTSDINEALRRAKNGESATFRGVNRAKIKELRRGLHTRIRRQGRTLAQELKGLGYKVDVLNGRIMDKDGVLEDNRVAEIFKDLGIIENIDTETYEQTDALSQQMQNILQDAENYYSPRESRIQTEHEEGIQAQLRLQEVVNDLLQDNQLGIKTIEELDELLARIESKPDEVDIVKVNRDAIKYLQAMTKKMRRDANDAIRQVKQQEKVNRENQYQLQNRMKNIIRSLPITGDHKVSLMGNIQRVKDANSFENVLNDVQQKAKGFMEQEQKWLNRRNIEETIKSTKPTKFRKQRYTYEDNKFFAELRDILKMSRAEALKAQEEFAKQIGLDRADGDVPLGINISEYDRLKNLLYYYKINGAESSLAALQDLATSLEELKSAAMNKRLDEDMLKSEVRKKDKDELLTGINSHERSNWFARKMTDIGTLYSTMNEYFGKKMADKWNLEVDFEKVNIFLRSRIKPVMDNAREIYGARRTSDFLNLMQQKSREDFELTDNDGDYQKLSILDIADIYLGMKDPNTRANYYASYEKFDDTMPTDKGQLRAAIEGMTDEQLKEHMLTNNLGKLLSYLTEEDMRFADMVQEEVGSMWALENEIFVKLYGIDLPRNKNYFPRTSKNSLDYDVMENLRVRGQTPGFFKERASTVTPRPKNIWLKYQEYVSSVGYVQNVALKYKDLRSLMTDKAIRGAITKKYGEDSYRAFMANLDDLSIKGAIKTYNEVGKKLQTLLNNLVSGTVALNVPMAFKQLPAALNYSVNMPKTEFVKNFLYAATHPAEVKKVMDSYVGDFLKTRFEQGSQSDAIGRAMAEANNLASSKFRLAGFSHSWRTFATAPIRFADIFAIYWGGYAKLKYNIDRGLTEEQVRDDFIRETLFNQAAGNPATLAKFQREQSLRFFTAFRNVPAQYMRLITTTMTQWRRGEISNDRFYSNIGNYVFIQPAMYVWLGWLIKSLLYGDDDDEWYDGMMTEMALAPIAGLPIIADLARFGLDKAESAITGKSPEPWDALQVFGVDTLNRLMWKLAKGDKTEWDYAEIIAGVIDSFTGAGLGTAVRTVKKLTD